MKYLIACIAVLGVAGSGYSQPGSPIVHDPTNHTVLLQQVKEAAKMSASANETVKNLRETKEFLTTINNALSQLDALEDLIKIQRATIKYSDNSLRELGRSGVLTRDEFNSLANSFAGSIGAITKNIDMANKLLTANLFKMNDAERLTFLQKTKEESQREAYKLYVQKKEWDLESARRIMYGKPKDNE